MVSVGRGERRRRMNLWHILSHASPISKMVFSVLILCSVLSIAVIVERWIVFNRAQTGYRGGA